MSFSGLSVVASCIFGVALAEILVSVDFGAESSVVGTYQTSPTLQVVSNPLLDREFALENGTRIPNPIHATAWASLRNLGADHVRFQPWFPYPHKAVAELLPPVAGKPTSWNFTDMMPQMSDFMDNTAAQGHSVTWNIGTIPCWMFWGPTTGGCPFPEDPDKSDFGYGERGIRAFMRDRSGKTLAAYLTRLTSWFVNGYMVDENGVTHSGGPKYNLSASAGHAFEFLNEGEHYYTRSEYINDYDEFVPALQAAVPEDKRPGFMGIGGCHDGFWNWWFMGNCTEWLTAFLDRSNHKDPNVPLDYASIHFYTTTSNRSDTDTYTKDFFGGADKFLVKMDAHVALRDRLSPDTKLAMTELGILMFDDMSETFDEETGGLPEIFFNAAAAFYTYVITQLASKRGIDFACFSQFVGSPPIAKWGIKDMQFPSGTMISWETGLGNAKYWALKLLLTHLHRGDTIHSTNVVETAAVPAVVRQTACEAVGPWTFDNEITLTCNDPHARIDHIWADMGLPPVGECGSLAPNKNCSNALGTTAWAAVKCFGRHSCTLKKEGKIQDILTTCPEQTIVKKSNQYFQQRLTVQARCSGDKGIRTSAEYSGDSVYSVGFTSADRKTKKLLFVNKQNTALDIKVDVAELGTAGATAHIVDPMSVQRGSSHGIRQEVWKVSGSSIKHAVVTLQPYAVVIVTMGNETTVTDSVTSVIV